MNVIETMKKDKILEILMKENPTPEEALVVESYRRGYLEGRQKLASEHNDMLYKALISADRARYRKMLRGFLAQYFTFLNSQHIYIDV